MNKKGFEFSFAWIFAIIVGATIIFLAIFAATSLIGSSRQEINTEVAAQLGILLNPIETNLETGKYSLIELPDETRFFNTCRNVGNFGSQGISTSVKRGIGEEFQDNGIEVSFFNKYIFSQSLEQGENLHVFSKPLKMPYKIADLVFLSSDDYCFVNPPIDIENEINSLSPGNINVSSSSSGCSRNSKIVCFVSSGCDINVNLDSKSVSKIGQPEVTYEGELIYGAIFADSGIYECQVQRLMKRAGELAHVYAGKTEYLSAQGCSTNMQSDLIEYASLTNIKSSKELLFVAESSEELRRKNERLNCRLF